jgi:serine/threonine protein kinase
MTTFQSKLGTLKVQSRLTDFFNIENYICRLDSSLYLLKLYKFYEFEIFYQRELQTIESLSHIPEVLPIKDHQQTKTFAFIIYDLGKFSHLPSTSINPSDELRLSLNILKAVEKIHKTNLIHTGLHSHNFFINGDLEVKIMGFETCTTLEELTEQWKNGQVLILAQENDWKAPELSDSGYPVSASLDLWSLGCLFFYLFRGNKFEGLEDAIRNSFVEFSNVKSRTLLKKLFIVDPELRATIDSAKAVISSDLPESEKRLSAFSQIISRSTRSWLKSVTKDKDSPPKKLVLAKLLKKASEKPEKIPKFYNHLASRPFYKPRVALKALLVLHVYWYAGRTKDLSQAAFQILDQIFAVWTDSKTRQKYFTGSTKQIVLEYVQILKNKLRVHSELLINCDWSECELDLRYFDDVFEYFKAISKFANIVFNMNEHVEIYLEILNLLLKEIMKITQVLINTADRMRNEAVQDFLEIRGKNSTLVQKVYLKYPFLEVTVGKDYLGHSLSQILSHGGSLQGSLSNISSICTSPAELSVSSESEPTSRSRSSSLFEGLEFEEMIGEGGSAKVFRGRYRNMQVAIKQMKTSLHQNDFLTEFNREIQTLSKLSHPNLVTFVGACVGEQHCIVTEFCAGGTLFALLHEQRTLKISWKQRTKFASDIAKGMQYLHSYNLLHRDLKSLNILLSDALNGNNEPVAKISDFGVSRVVNDGVMTGSIGTCHWMAPEVIRGESYGLPSDVFSFGIVMYELLSRETPYKGLDPKSITYQVVNLRKRPDVNLIASTCPAGLKTLMIRCWNENPELRPNFGEIVKELNKLI